MALVASGLTLWAWWAGAPVLGELWFNLDPFSLNLTQAVVQRYLHPGLWDAVLLPVLFQPTALVTGLLALLFGALAWWTRPRPQ
ncbi:MAG: hypothetical protein EA356_08320 [Geminicoccaceae bacterium]|nr:MAG: hypothetical protein EA356_08320 [Geminicoccaceae bacterium]